MKKKSADDNESMEDYPAFKELNLKFERQSVIQVKWAVMLLLFYGLL